MSKDKSPPEYHLYSDYSSLTKVQHCKKLILEQLGKGRKKEEFVVIVGNIIRLMLCQRESFHMELDRYRGDLSFILKLTEAHSKRYHKTIRIIEDTCKASGMKAGVSNPTRFGITTNPDIVKSGTSFKHYRTLHIKNYQSITQIPKLALALQAIAKKTDDQIKLKLPCSLLGFISHTDTLVIHYKDLANHKAISKALFDRSTKQNIQYEDRELGRTTHAYDAHGQSFSELVAHNIASWIFDRKMENKRSDEIIAEQGILHSIQHSKNDPTIKLIQ